MQLNRYIQTRAYIFLLAIGMSFAGCKPDPQQNTKQVFHLNMSVGLESFDPAFAQQIYVMWATHMVYNTLVETDEKMMLRPSLSKGWTVSEDGLLYTIYLRSNVYFQDNPLFPEGKGRKMTAADVVYSFKRLIDPKVASTGSWIFNDIIVEKDPFVAINDTTLQIKLRKPFRLLMEMLSMPYCSIVPKEAADHWGKDFRSHPCGTGPFMLKYWDEGNILVLHKNPHYWEADSTGKPLPYLDAVQVSFYDTKAVEFLLFMQGKIDFINGVDRSYKDLVLQKNGELKKEYVNKINLTKNTYLNTEYIGFLTDTSLPIMQNAATKNVLVRQAINYAIDRDKIVTYFKNGAGRPATGGFTPVGIPGFENVAEYGYRYDPKKALQLLEQAGYPNGKGLPPISVQVADNYADVVSFVASELEEIGIKMNVEIIQPAILKQQMSKGQSLMFRGNWIADYPDAESFLSFFNSPSSPPNYTRFRDATFDKWYNDALAAPDSLRYKLYKQMDSLAISKAPLIPLYYELMFHFTGKNVTGLRTNPMNLIDLKQVTVK